MGFENGSCEGIWNPWKFKRRVLFPHPSQRGCDKLNKTTQNNCETNSETNKLGKKWTANCYLQANGVSQKKMNATNFSRATKKHKFSKIWHKPHLWDVWESSGTCAGCFRDISGTSPERLRDISGTTSGHLRTHVKDLWNSPPPNRVLFVFCSNVNMQPTFLNVPFNVCVLPFSAGKHIRTSSWASQFRCARTWTYRSSCNLCFGVVTRKDAGKFAWNTHITTLLANGVVDFIISLQCGLDCQLGVYSKVRLGDGRWCSQIATEPQIILLWQPVRTLVPTSVPTSKSGTCIWHVQCTTI